MPSQYVHPEVLVSTEWVDHHKSDPTVRIVEVDIDTSAYEQGHIEGAFAWNWESQLCDDMRRDILSRTKFDELMQTTGITADTTVVLYGDHANWFACYAFWQMKLFRHRDVRIMNGGRRLWIAQNRPMTKQVPDISYTTYHAKEPDISLRAMRDLMFHAIRDGRINIVDVRSPDEYTGKIVAPDGMAETALRAGHIPRAINVPWDLTTRPDGTFADADQITRVYEQCGVTPYADTITYCRIGERSAHSWFVLKYLLGYHNVRNYDGSWTEWGNLVGVPIIKGSQPV